MPDTPAGWYPDPEQPPGHRRYWDGQQWTEHRRWDGAQPTEHLTTTPAQTGSGSTSVSRPGWIARHKKISGLVVILLLIWLVGVLGEDEPEGGADNVTASPEASEPSDSPEAEEAPSATPSESATPRASKTPKPSKSPKTTTRSPRPPKPTSAPRRLFFVSRVIDGDTVELGDGQTVRLVGIDTPEVGQCGFDRATDNLERLILGQRVRLTVSDEDTDRYGRLLRYINIGSQDAGLRLIKNGLAIARYDSRDGYGFHPREPAYIAADRASKNFRCPPPAPSPPPPPSGGGNCAAGYEPCIPPYPPDLNCDDVGGPIYVTGSDPHGLDAENDGVGCE